MIAAVTRISPVISPSELAPRLADPALCVVDCRASLQDPAAGRAQYLKGHLLGARFADLLEDLSGPIEPGRTGRHPLPSVAALTHRFRTWGIGDSTLVVAYDDAGGAFAARLWWLLRWLGHEQAAVLDGGLGAWLAAGQLVTAEPPQPRLGNFAPRERPELLAFARSLTGESTARKLFDARAPERYRGDVEPIDPVAGHIPGAVNLPFAENLRDGKFREPAELRVRFDSALAGAAPEEAVIYCGSGVTACHDVLAFELAGLPLPKLYAGSWSEWITDPTRPVAKG